MSLNVRKQDKVVSNLQREPNSELRSPNKFYNAHSS